MAEQKNTTKETEAKKLVAIRLKGSKGIDVKIKDTLFKLNLKNQHNAVILENKPTVMGMLKKVKDNITWGYVNDATIKDIVDKKGKKKVYTLHPPKGGFERKGIKVPYSIGGALGYRDNMDDLLKKML